MKLKKFFLIFLLALSFLPFYKINAANSNVGFVPANIWYSQDPFEEGDKIKIYTLVFNPENKELSGTVTFFDQETILGKRDFKIPAKGLKDLSIDWTATVGKHTIFAKIENAKFLISKDKYEEVYLTENESEKSVKNISKKVEAKIGDSIGDAVENSAVNNVKNLIQEKTPAFIAKPIIATTDALETFRKSTGEKSIVKKEEAQKAIEDIKIAEEKKPSENKALKPFKYLEMFFFQLVSFIFGNQFVFYIVLFALVFLIVRFIWNKIF